LEGGGRKMIYANDIGKEKIRANPGAKGFCPLCEEPLTPKCGKINVWHWSHKKDNNCSGYGESETEWHLWWKNQAKKECVEVVVEKWINNIVGLKKKIIDIVSNDGTAIEVQHSAISAEEIEDRNNFHGSVIWIFDMRDCFKRICFRDKGDYWTFKWEHPRKSQFSALKRGYLFWDITDGSYVDEYYGIIYEIPNEIFEVKKIYLDDDYDSYGRRNCAGWGKFISRKEFIKKHIYLMTTDQEKLINRIKAGKEWLILNRREWLDYHGQKHFFDFHRWVDNWHLYLDLFDEAYRQDLVEGDWLSLFHSWAIEDLMPELRKIFPAKRFEETAIDTLS
jgi:competence protein CoiA